MNNAHLIGRLTKEPELRTSTQGNSCLHFTLAVNRRYKGKDGGDTADFIPCVAWRKRADAIAKYCHKGSRLSVSGPMESRVFEPNNGGSKKYIIELNVREFEFLDARKKEDTPAESGQKPVPEGQVCSAPADEEEVSIF